MRERKVQTYRLLHQTAKSTLFYSKKTRVKTNLVIRIGNLGKDEKMVILTLRVINGIVETVEKTSRKSRSKH